jgi:PPOX class probable FMN-dependent enzyme
VIVEDDRHILIADRPGNNRIDGLLNVLKHPRVGTVFLIPSVRETLRVNGTATIHAEPEVLERCRMKGGLPITVMRIEVEEVFLHCAKALLRSRLWEPKSWPAERPVPVMSDMIRDHIGEDLPHEADEAMVARYATMLY